MESNQFFLKLKNTVRGKIYRVKEMNPARSDKRTM